MDRSMIRSFGPTARPFRALAGMVLGMVLLAGVAQAASTTGTTTTTSTTSMTTSGSSAQSAGQGYEVTVLVSDLSGLGTTDANLVNPWGIAHSASGPWWVSNNGTGTSTVYNAAGAPFPANTPLIVTLPAPAGSSGAAVPTGIVAFEGASGFEVSAGNPARFIFVAEDGSIYGWNSTFNQTTAKLVTTVAGAVYKGATLATNNGQTFLYAANFMAGTVDVFDSTFKKVSPASGAFTDPSVPAGFAPFGIQNIDGKIYVSYAKQNADKTDDVSGEGLGYIAVFNPNGTRLQSLPNGTWLDAPWGMALAPAGFGEASGQLLVGNFGSGKIAVLNPDTGAFQNFLTDRFGRNIIIEGLWGLVFGNGATAGPDDSLFFAAGINGEDHGEFGSITSVAGASSGTAGSIGGSTSSQSTSGSTSSQSTSGSTSTTGTAASATRHNP